MLEAIANIIGVVGGVYAVYRYFEASRVAPVRVAMVCADEEVLSISIPRSQFSRAELIGRLAMVSKVPRLNVAALANVSILHDIDAVVAGKTSRIDIALTAEEKGQF